AVLILGEDVTHTAPRMALSIRQAARGIAVEMGAGLGLQPWQDAAIRNLAQDSRYPVFIAAPHATRLDDIAKETLRLNPGDIASLGEAIATRIQKGASADVFEGMLGAQAGRIAEKLAGAKRPLIVAGTAYSSVAIIQAAKAVAKSLAGDNCQPMLSFCLPEANSLGAALFDSAGQSLEDIHLRAIRGEIDTLVVVENDLHLRLSSEKVDQLFDSVERLIVLDCVDNPTISRADLALPSAAFTEAEGTLVNHEGRAQRFYPVINPLTNPASQRKPAWQWLSRIGNQLGYKQFSELMHFDQIEKACASANAKLKDIIRAAPDAAFRSHGEKIPRQPHRYSGRTAMNAGVSVHEPQQPSDQETPLAWSMEGAMPGDTPALLPYVWSPGWNSNQSLHRFQQEVGGPLRGGSAGVRLLDGCDSPVSDGGENSREETTFEENFIHRGDDFLMLPIYRIFGSEELSRRSPAIAKCCDYPFVALHPADAERLNVNEGDGVHVDTAVDAFEVRLDDSLVPGTVGYLAGQYQSAGLRAGSRRVISKAEQWQRRGMSTADLIASDGGGQ
ncbi:MAG: molybdopterin-dependent oxidoreductase, partial [bacterium]